MEVVGVLHIHSETGTEGGWYAFQDAAHIRTLAPEEQSYFCVVCGAARTSDERGDIQVASSLPVTQEMVEAVLGGEGWTAPEPCEVHRFASSGEMRWSYDGLKLLQNGDRLEVRDPDSGETLWVGVVALEPVAWGKETAGSLWVRQLPENVEREQWQEWFLGRYPATLTR